MLRPLVLFLLLLTWPATADVAARLAVYNPDEGPVRMVLRVENASSQEVVISQADGQAYEFVVSQDGEPVWKWSHSRFFLQAQQDLVLAPGEIKAFDASWDRKGVDGRLVPRGHYQVEAFVPRTNGDPLRAQPRHLVIKG